MTSNPLPSVLIVDDEAINILALANALKSEYQVRNASSGKAALEIIHAADLPDLVLLDIMMPEMDGFAVCGQLKADERTRDIPVIFITARGEQADEVRGLAMGAVDYITKPFSLLVVQAKLRTHLALKQSELKFRANAIEQQKTNKALRDSEERYRLIIETAQEGVVGTDADYNVTYANPRMHSMLGHAPGELTGCMLVDLLVPEDAAILRQKQGRRRQGISEQYELRFRHKRGHKVWTLISASPVNGPDGSFAGSIGMVTDISDRVRAEVKLRKNEARYRTLVESMQEGLLMTCKNNKFSFINDQFSTMLGRPKASILGHKVVEFAAPESSEHLTAMLSGKGSERGAEEIIWVHNSGRHIYTLVSPSVILDERGRFAGAFAITTDTTERKTLENRVLQSQKLEAIGQLAAGIAHEINTPAQYVGNNVQFIKEAFEHMMSMCGEFRHLLEAAKTGPVPQEMIQAVEAAIVKHDLAYLEEEMPNAIAQTLEGVERISVIVRSVKQFAHPGSTGMVAADLNEAIRSTAVVSRNEWKYVSDLKTDLDPSLPLVECMISEINQVVLNLIINAVHAITDAIEIDPQGEWLITLSTRENGPWAEIRVTDTGTGIPPDVQPKIFDPFFTTKEVGKGTGQGLAISRSIIVEKHKGQIFFETEPGKGTTFIVRLPIEQKRDAQ